MKDVAEMTQAELYSEIADFISDALRGADEAYQLAKQAWGERDKRTEALNCLWAECETQLREFMAKT